MDNRVKPIFLKGNSNKTFFLFHGYTGGPRDFELLPELLNKEFSADVKVIQLKGHGTKVEDLLNYNYSDFIKQAELEIEKDLKKGKKIVVIGFSFGGLIALYLATKYNLEGVVSICSPIKLKFPLNLRLLSYLRFFKPILKKKLSDKEKEELNFSSYYDAMPILGLKICQDASKNVSKNLSKIKCPILSIFSKKDHLTSVSSRKKIERKTLSFCVKNLVFDEGKHRPSSEKFRNLMKKEIITFINENCFKERMNKEKIVAIIPAYNEERKIKNVLEQIEKSSLIDEIVVVDDGSTDKTEEIVKKFKKIKFIKNKMNMGKAFSMDRGVNSTDADILFFCDADLDNLTPEIIEKIITPVLNKEVDMFIGLRKNKMQQAIKLFALNSGERALRRSVWEHLPKFYKNKYRIEAGLNYYTTFYGNGFSYDSFDYFQTLKEKKYGFLKGTYLRWKMNLDVFLAYIMAYGIDLPKKTIKKLYSFN